MSKIEVDAITQQSGTTLTVGGGACKTATVDATTVTLGRSGGTVSLASGATQSGFGRTGTVDWDTTPKTATFSAVSGNGYFCNTTAGAFTVNLPAGSAGAIVSLADYAATWQTSNVTVSPNGSEKIGSVAGDATLNTEGQSVTFVFVDSTQGWVNTMDSTSNVRGVAFICASVSGACNTLATVDTNYKVATFVGPGTFTVNSGVGSVAVVDYLVVAGGGAGLDGPSGGGGGGGGFRESHVDATSGPYSVSPLAATSSLPMSPGAFPITIGAGGAPSGNPGSNTIFSSITSTGGGGGSFLSSVGAPGGSGGGSTFYQATTGAGNTPPVSPPQGQPGGTGTAPGTTGNYPAGGGGGATEAGVNGPPSGPSPSGRGGTGATTSITGSAVARSGGGGGGSYAGEGVPANGAGSPCGTGGAGTGAAGTVNKGGGGGSNGPGGTGGSGGSGIVIIRYKFQ
jgi:hypothetical protein